MPPPLTLDDVIPAEVLVSITYPFAPSILSRKLHLYKFCFYIKTFMCYFFAASNVTGGGLEMSRKGAEVLFLELREGVMLKQRTMYGNIFMRILI